MLLESYLVTDLSIKIESDPFHSKLNLEQSCNSVSYFKSTFCLIAGLYPHKKNKLFFTTGSCIKDVNLLDIYNHYAAPISPGDPKIMRLNKFIELITASGVCDDNFGAREIGVIYNLSMMTQVDEIHNTRHMDMRFIEFVEAVSRVADKAMSRKT